MRNVPWHNPSRFPVYSHRINVRIRAKLYRKNIILLKWMTIPLHKHINIHMSNAQLIKVLKTYAAHTRRRCAWEHDASALTWIHVKCVCACLHDECEQAYTSWRVCVCVCARACVHTNALWPKVATSGQKECLKGERPIIGTLLPAVSRHRNFKLMACSPTAVENNLSPTTCLLPHMVAVTTQQMKLWEYMVETLVLKTPIWD